MKPLVPTEIETERLILRQFCNDDWRDLHVYYSDVEATRYTSGHPLTEAETWRAMASMVGHWQLCGFGPYAIEKKEAGVVMGVVGFWYPADWPEPEIKWGLAPTYWGQGYAAEAVRSVLKAGKRHLPELALISLIDKRNVPSINLAKAVGATLEREIDFRGRPAQIFRHRSD